MKVKFYCDISKEADWSCLFSAYSYDGGTPFLTEKERENYTRVIFTVDLPIPEPVTVDAGEAEIIKGVDE